MPLPTLIKFAPLLTLLVWAAVIDARERRIPNWLTFGLLLGGFGRAVFFGHPHSIFYALLGMLLGAAIPLVLYAMSAIGAGDVKLMAAIGIWLGPGPVFVIFLLEKVIGLIIILVQATMQGTTSTLFRNSALVTLNLACAGETGLKAAIDAGKDYRSVQRPLPYAVPVLIATLIVLSIGSMAGR